MDKFIITQEGKPLYKSWYNIDIEAKTFSSKEHDLVLDFKGLNGWTFTTGNKCMFKAGDKCAFKTGYKCIFDVGNYCTLNTSWGCKFDTLFKCIFNTGQREPVILVFSPVLVIDDPGPALVVLDLTGVPAVVLPVSPRPAV